MTWLAKSAANAVKFETLEPQFQDPVNVLRLFSTKSAGFNPATMPSKRKKGKGKNKTVFNKGTNGTKEGDHRLRKKE